MVAFRQMSAGAMVAMSVAGTTDVNRGGMNASLQLLRSATRIGFVFSGGASRCAFQIGVVEALGDLGIRPAVCVGVSGGSWIAAAVAAGAEKRLRYYWKSFVRMPSFSLKNLLVEHSPYIYNHIHERTFSRYIGSESLRRPDSLPLFVGVTRLSDRKQVLFDARTFDDPLRLLLASNYLPPYYTHAIIIDGERYGDGGLSDNIPYQKAFNEGCDAVVLVSMKGESEGNLYRNPRDFDHIIPPPFADRTVVIRPRHRLPLSFTERRWSRLQQIIQLGYLRTGEVLLDERHAQTELRSRRPAPSLLLARLFRGRRGSGRSAGSAPAGDGPGQATGRVG